MVIWDAVLLPMICAPSMSGRTGKGTFVSPTIVTVRVTMSSVETVVRSTCAVTGMTWA